MYTQRQHKRILFSRKGSGFTLIEVVLVIALLVLVFSFTLGVGSEFYFSQSLVAERDSLVNLLRRTRTRAMSNINQSDHGIFIDASQYIIFEGDSYASRDSELDETFPRTGGADIGGPAEIVFAALEGTSNVSDTISITTASGKVDISINYEGRIQW